MTDPATAALLADLRQTFMRMDEALKRAEKHFTHPHTPWDGRAGSAEDDDGFVQEGNEHGR